MVTANIATIKGRERSLEMAVRSLLFQVDRVRIYFNDYEPHPKTFKHPHIDCVVGAPDMGAQSKFFWALEAPEDEIYLSCDDDIIYPPDYVVRTLINLDKYEGSIVTYHGRRLWHGDIERSYYHTHAVFNFMQGWQGDQPLDTAGTGVMACRIGDIRPMLYNAKHRNMCDVLLGLQAAQEGVKIFGIGHSAAWFGYIKPEGKNIYATMNQNDTEQRKIAAEIWKIKHGQK